ncbi:MAG: glucose-6-phosphate isomerase family protein, partial [Oscillospiraceae bacterium]
RGIRFPEDKALLDSKNFRYDITIVMDGLVNGECKKTSGHYHGFNPERTNTYAEVYEVIKGTALYVLQKADNFDIAPTDVVIDDLILAVVKEGQTIIIPPNYGHCSVNIGEGPLVFSNLAYVPCPVNYDSVKHYHGMSYYIKKKNGKVEIELNKNYKNVPNVKFASVKENPKLGIKFGLPVYISYKNDPNAFEFLENPNHYVDEVMSMLDIKKSLEEVL